MFISLRWKSIIFVSAVLILLTATWTWQTVSKQIKSFNENVESEYQSNTNLLDELVAGDLVNLSQFSQLITNNIVLPQSNKISSQSQIENKSILKESWLFFNVNLNLDYIALYDDESKLIEEVSSDLNTKDRYFRNNLKSKLTLAIKDSTPADYIYCRSNCYLIVIEPFIDNKDKAGFIVMAQNMVDLVQLYASTSSSELAIVVKHDDTNNAIRQKRLLSNVKGHVWALSNFNNYFPVLRNYTEKHSDFLNENLDLHKLDGNSYLFKQITLSTAITGMPTQFVSVANYSRQYKSLINNIYRGVIISLLILLVSEGILLLIINRFLKKLLNITNSLFLLPQQKFDEFKERVSPKKTLIKDEISVLQKSTFDVASDLQELNNEVVLKNDTLEKQVTALEKSRGFLSRLFNNSQTFVITQTLDNHLETSNLKFQQIFNKVPKNFCDILATKSEKDEFLNKSAALSEGRLQSFQHHTHITNKNNSHIYITWIHSIVENEQGNKIILSTGMDQTVEKQTEKDLAWLADHDGLTGIGNRRSFNKQLETLFKNESKGALIFIDVNRFKQINDIYGHNVGDDVLINIANKLKENIGKNDLISRFAGDEFTIVCPEINRIELSEYLEKITTSLNTNVRLRNGGSISYTVSAGAALFPVHGGDAETLIVNADLAMYNAKDKGLGGWHIFDRHDPRAAQLKSEHETMLTIREAIKEDSFELHYQPIFSFAKKAISHYEVLIRMKDSAREKISPNIFIPLAEKTGEIRIIDKWVVNEALSHLNKILQLDSTVVFTVNISAPTLQSDEFSETILKALEHYNIPSKSLIIELTETSYIENFQQVLKNLREITDHGVRVALDDFGVGFSSFTYLKKLPLAFVKLDGSYIRDILKNKSDQVFVESLATMIKAFGMQTIAEFIEDQETLDLLIELGVSHGQGYHIGKPSPFVEYFGDIEK